MIDWMDYLKQAVEHQASDVFFVAGGPEKSPGKRRWNTRIIRSS